MALVYTSGQTLAVGGFRHIDLPAIDEHAGVAARGIGSQRTKIMPGPEKTHQFPSLNAPHSAASVVPVPAGRSDGAIGIDQLLDLGLGQSPAVDHHLTRVLKAECG